MHTTLFNLSLRYASGSPLVPRRRRQLQSEAEADVRIPWGEWVPVHIYTPFDAKSVEKTGASEVCTPNLW